MAKARRKRTERADADKYLQVGRSLRRTAADLNDLGESAYGNALGILCIHSAIAYTDAVTIRAKGLRAADQHGRAADLLAELFPANAATTRAVRSLRILLSRKDDVEYSGSYYSIEDAQAMFGHLESYADWVETLYLRLA